ncbi:AAEL011035-PA [Aedes aegypti]|uniref:AAEL011035-PA n=1 Tax=Aedes aegypti TaxID=7159 RepID=Q16R84_AEDAE|nr:AAEL011035-PA [Aedes aegypti]
MLGLIVIFSFAFAAILAGPLPSKQFTQFENIIQHNSASPNLIHRIIPAQKPMQDDHLKKLVNEVHAYPEYEFAYGARDPKTGDHKDQWEKRVGDHVQGIYVLEEADGTKRIVEYESDDKQGFRAKVTNVGPKHPEGSIKAKSDRVGVATSYNMLTKAN